MVTIEVNPEWLRARERVRERTRNTHMIKTTIKAAALVGAMLVPGVASAATAAIVTVDLNIRSGPGTGYQAFASIPAGNRVTVYGCASGYNWCDVDWAGYRGWVSGSYLAYREGSGSYYNRPVSSVGVYIGVPVIGYDLNSYHDRYYRGRSWYRSNYDRGPDRWDRNDNWRDRDRWRDRDDWRGNDDWRDRDRPRQRVEGGWTRDDTGSVVSRRWLQHQRSIEGERNR
jgi:uncharacterized protein YraI